MAAATASPTRPGSDCQVPKPTEGILAPVLSSKNRISFDIFFSRNPNRWLNPSSEKMMLRGLKLLLKRSVVFLGGSFRKFSATYFFIIFGKKSYVLYFFF